MLYLNDKNTKNPRTRKLVLEMNDVEPEDLLIYIDIITAVDYFGITELLDTIGVDRIREYLQSEITD